MPSILLEGFTPTWSAALFGLFKHEFHVRKNLIHVMLLSTTLGLCPKLAGISPDGRQKTLILHCSRGQGAVKIVGESNACLA